MALSLGSLLQLGAVQPLENLAYNALFRLRGEIPWDDRIVLIKIDDASIQRFGRFPWPRRYYTQLLNRLTPAEPSAIAIDLIWSEPTPDDAPLADAIAQNGRVVLPFAQDLIGMPLMPVPVLRHAAIGTGHIHSPIDSDGMTRKLPLQFRGEAALGWSTVATYSLTQAPMTLPDADQYLWPNWPGPVNHLRQYAFADVLAGKVAPQVFHNKIVLLGVTATAIDPMVSPFNPGGTASGIHLHATLINSLLQGNALRPLGQLWIFGLLVAGGPLLSLLLSFLREEGQIVVWGIACVGWGTLAVVLLRVGSWLLPVGLPLALFTGTAAAVSIGERLRISWLLQRQIHYLWQRYHSDLVSPSPSAPTPPRQPRFFGQPSEQNSGSLHSLAQLTDLSEQLGKSQSTQAAIARSLSVGILAADWNGRIWFCNPVMQHWLTVQVGDRLTDCLIPAWVTMDQWQRALQYLPSASIPSASIPSASMPPASMPPVSTALPTSPPEVLEFQRGDRWLELKLEPLTYPTSMRATPPTPASAAAQPASQTGLLLLLEDITLRKQSEIALAQQVQELEALNNMKDEFLSTVSHELRAPMTNIRLVIELLPSAETEAEILQYLEILERECTRETNLINDLLDFQRLESGLQTLNLQRIDLAAWLPELVRPYRERAAAQQQSLQLRLAESLPPLVSDRACLDRVLTELLNNACKYTPLGGSLILAVRATASHLQFTVQNSDTEIPAAELPRIFDKFYRIPHSDRLQQGGTGLGLALVKKLVEHLGGTIAVQSNRQKTTFTVAIPIGG